MPGIVGVACGDSDLDVSEVTASMISTLERKGRFRKSLYCDGDFSLANIELPVNFSIDKLLSKSSDARYVCSVYGNVLDYGSYSVGIHEIQQADVKSQLSKSSSILNLYIKHGEKIFSEIKGEYVFAIIDTKEKYVILGNDHLGLMPLYYKSSEKGFYFSSEVKALIGASAKDNLNFDAISDFLVFGYLLGEKTFFKDILLLPPASLIKYSINSKKLEITSYWNLSEYMENESYSLNEGDSLEELNALFVASVNKRTKGVNTGIALSGGMDSRVILSVVAAENEKFPTITSGIGECIDKKITRQLSDEVGFNHIYSDYTKDIIVQNIYEHADQVVEITDGMRGAPYNALTILGGEKYTGCGLDNILYGHGGELAKLGEAYGLSIDDNVKQMDDIDVIPYMYGKASIPQWKTLDLEVLIQNKELLHAINESKERFSTIFSKFNDAVSLPLEQKVSYYFLNEFVRKFTVLSFGVHRDFVNTHVPFLDVDFIKALLKTTPSLRSKRFIHSAIIDKNFRSLLDIPLSQTRVRIQPSPYEKMFKNIPYRVLCRIGFYKNDKPENLIKSLIDGSDYRSILLDKTTENRGLFSVSVISDALDKFETDKASLIFLSRLYLLEIWFRKFID